MKWFEGQSCLLQSWDFCPHCVGTMRRGGLMARSWIGRSWFSDSWPDTVLRFCSFTLTAPLSTQEYKWVPANCWGNLTNCGEVTFDGLASRQGGEEILLATSCYINQDKLRQLKGPASQRQGFIFCVLQFTRCLTDAESAIVSLKIFVLLPLFELCRSLVRQGLLIQLFHWSVRPYVVK